MPLLRENPGIRIGDIAAQLCVSEGTIRNDLRLLAEEGQLDRVRGGGVPRQDNAAFNSAFVARLRVRQNAKRRIARWTAALVQNGDTIILDASTTVYFLAEYLDDHHNLTIITNGVEVGRRLARNRSNTVILLGGVLNADGSPVGEMVSEQFLANLHIKTAFVSCAGFAPAVGLTERDLMDAQLKRKMIAAAASVVALIDSSKFGQVSFAPSVHTHQVARIFTDDELDRAWIPQLQATCPMITLCGQDHASDVSPCAESNQRMEFMTDAVRRELNPVVENLRTAIKPA